MNGKKPVIIVLAIALVVAVAYIIYLHQGPIKNISTEHRNLTSEIARLKAASEEIKAGHKSDLAHKYRLMKKSRKR